MRKVLLKYDKNNNLIKLTVYEDSDICFQVMKHTYADTYIESLIISADRDAYSEFPINFTQFMIAHPEISSLIFCDNSPFKQIYFCQGLEMFIDQLITLHIDEYDMQNDEAVNILNIVEKSNITDLSISSRKPSDIDKSLIHLLTNNDTLMYLDFKRYLVDRAVIEAGKNLQWLQLSDGCTHHLDTRKKSLIADYILDDINIASRYDYIECVSVCQDLWDDVMLLENLTELYICQIKPENIKNRKFPLLLHGIEPFDNDVVLFSERKTDRYLHHNRTITLFKLAMSDANNYRSR